MILSYTASCYTAAASYYWTFAGSNSSPSTLPNPPPITYPSTGIYYITLDVTNECGSTSVVKQIVVDSVIAAHAGHDTAICGTSITMMASSAGPGTGIWTIISFPPPTPPTIVTQTSPSTVINNLRPGTYIFQWTITNGGCKDSSRVTVVVAAGPTPANAGPDQNLCMAGSTTLAGNSPAIGTGTWNAVSGPNIPAITFSNISSPTSTVSGLITGVYVFTWTTSFNNCTASVDTVKITIADNPTPANAGPDQVICTLTSALTGNSPLTGTGNWNSIGSPAPIILNPGMPTTGVTFPQSGIYLFVWTITNNPCNPSTDTVQVTVSAIANNSISGNQMICINTIPAGISGSTPSGGNGGYIYQWQESINGGSWNNIAGETNINYNPGLLTQSTCYRRIVNTALCSGSQGDTSAVSCVTVNPDARAIFSVNNTFLCSPVNIDTVITVTPFSGRNALYKWYRDGILISSSPTAAPPSYLISTPGQTIVITLITTSSFGCQNDTMSITLHTRPVVIPTFTKNVIAGCDSLIVTFTNSTIVPPNAGVQFFWDFGNGETLNNVIDPPFPIVYHASPFFRDTTYYITLRVVGCTTVITTDSVTVFANPKARFTSKPTGCSPFRDTIINNSFGQDTLTTYYWDFGDGSMDTTFSTGSVYHTYNTGVVDTFTIRLIMVNRCSRDTQYMNVIVSPANIQQNITVSGTGLFGCPLHTAYFQNSSLGASFLVINFGDGSPLDTIPNSQSVFSHTFINPGTYNVQIKLMNDCTDTTVQRQITVYPPLEAAFTILKTLVCSGDTIFTNNTSTNANSYEWLWGDNSTSTTFNASHIYATAGIYTVRLVAKRVNAFGTVCTDTSAAIVVTVVARIPSIVVINNNTPPCVPYIINVFAAGATNAQQVDWYFYIINPGKVVFIGYLLPAKM